MRLWLTSKVSLIGTLCHLIHASGWLSQDTLLGDVVHDNSPLAFSLCWNSLGPFRVGTREAIWGADPIELLGGIRSITYNEHNHYSSPLTQNATVQWNNRTFYSRLLEDSAYVELNLDYPDVDWKFAQQIYGWSAFQFQAWMKGELIHSGNAPQRALLYTNNILELWVGENHIFGGDFYGFRRSPIVIELQPGPNTVSIRLVGDIRSMGGIFPPTLKASLEAKTISNPLEIDNHGILLPDVVNGQFCSLHGSVVVRNQAASWIKIEDLATSQEPNKSILASQNVWLAPGQSRPINILLDFEPESRDAIRLMLNYTLSGHGSLQTTFTGTLKHANTNSLQKVTFLHSSGAVSYAILRPPPNKISSLSTRELPVLVNLHGAGVEADSAQVRAMFAGVPNLPAWILSPTGMSQWSGDDWHTWGFADVQTAVSMIPDWIERLNWTGPGVHLEKLLIAGHSNGGQGTWYFSTHQPDRILAAVAASGYSSIENYVPYHLWNEADPAQSAILHAARSNYRHELLVENLVGLPIFQQHGSADDNVPPYHSRLMNTLLAQAGQHANYSEMPGKGHWFEGSMTTEPMVDFYLNYLNREASQNVTVPATFSFLVPNSHDFGSRHGIVVDQLSTPDRMGKVEVAVQIQDSRIQWRVKTSNIHRLHFDHRPELTNKAEEVLFDDMLHPFELQPSRGSTSFVKHEPNLWGKEVALDWRNLEQRFGRQRGTLDSILRTSGPFQLVYGSDESLSTAVQASRNLYQYYGADTNLIPLLGYQDAVDGLSNIIVFAMGQDVPRTQVPNFPVFLENDKLKLTTRDGEVIHIPFSPGLGGVWLRPLPIERLELIVWGVDEAGLHQAARLVPTLTGAGQPDFVIIGDSAKWKGHGGAIAMGFFDYGWRISAGSYLP